MRFLIVILCLVSIHSVQLYDCINNAFQGSCKKQLYACTNNPDCSYQLHENTKHIFLNQQSTVFPLLYFSNGLARTLYECLRTTCQLPPIDENYPKTLPLDYCLM